jgi:chorismate synthase
MLRYSTAGESHGKGLITIIEGLPAGLSISAEDINKQLQRRQKGYGRGGRMVIESDEVEILSGVRAGFTTGSPIAFIIKNRDWENWQDIMAVENTPHSGDRTVKRPRPGHADYPGAIKYNHTDMRNVLERASARETIIERYELRKVLPIQFAFLQAVAGGVRRRTGRLYLQR